MIQGKRAVTRTNIATTVIAQRTDTAPSRRGGCSSIACNRSWKTVEIELHHAVRLSQTVHGGVSNRKLNGDVRVVMNAQLWPQTVFEGIGRRPPAAGGGASAPMIESAE